MEQIHQLERSLKYAKTDLEEAVIHSNIGVLYEKLGNLHEALEHHKKELQFSRNSDNQKMLAYRFLAECYRKLRKFGKSSQCNEKHLSLATKLADKLETQRAYCNKGNLYLDLSEKLQEQDKDEDFLHNIKMSLENFKKSLKICEALIQDIKSQHNSSLRGEEKEQLILNCKRLFNEAQFNIGNCYFVWGKYEPNYFKDAIDSLTKAATYAKSLKNPILEGKAYSSMGLIRFNQKEYNEAEAYFKKDATICEANKDYQGLMLTLRNIARLYHARRQYETSIERFEKAKEICRRHLDSDDVDEIQQEIHEVENEKKLKKDIEEKIKKYDQLERKKDYSREYLLLGKEIIERLCDSLEDYEKALPITKQFIQVLKAMAPNDETLSGASLSLVTKMHSYMGIINQNLKRFDDGKKYFQEAMRVIERNDSRYEKNSDYLTLLIDFGNVMDDAGDKVEEIEEIYWRAFNLGQKAGFPNIIKASLNNLELVYKKTKDKTELQRVKEMKKKLSDIFEPPQAAESEEDDDDDLDVLEAEMYENSKRTASNKKLSSYTEMEVEFATPEKKREEVQIISSGEPDEDFFLKENLYAKYYSKSGKTSTKETTVSKEPSSSKKTTLKEDLLRKTSKKQKALAIDEDDDDNDTVSKKRRSSFERYDQYVQKHGIPVVKNIQTQLEQRHFSIKGQLMSNWAVKSAIKSLKYSSTVEDINIKNNRAMTDCLGLFNRYLTNGGCFSRLKSLNIAYNPLVGNNSTSKASLIQFSKLVLTKLNLDYLNLSGIKLEDEVAKKFFETLNDNNTLETLKLKNCHLRSVYLEHFRNKTLKTFVVSENSLGVSSIKALLLSEKFPSLKKLKVSFQDFYPRLKPSITEDEVAMATEGFALARAANPELETLEIKGLDPTVLISICKELRFQDTLSNLKVLDLSETKDIDLLFESTSQSLMNNKFTGMHSSIRVSVFKANKVTFTYEDNIVSLFKFLSLMNFLQEFELQDVPLRQSDVEGLCEALSNFCLYISKINLLGSLKEYSQAVLIKDRVTSLKFCFADL